MVEFISFNSVNGSERGRIASTGWILPLDNYALTGSALCNGLFRFRVALLFQPSSLCLVSS